MIEKFEKVPYMVVPHGTLDRVRIQLYTSEEMTKMFLLQVYETGFAAASDTFGLNDKDIANRAQIINAQLMSNPLGNDYYNFFTLCYNNTEFISALELIFRTQIEKWCQKMLPYGTGAFYMMPELSQILENNYAIKAVYTNTSEEEFHCIGAVTPVFLTVINHQADDDVRQLFSKLLSHQCLTYIDATLALQALANDKQLCLNYYVATLLQCFQVNSNYNSTIMEVRKAYGL